MYNKEGEREGERGGECDVPCMIINPTFSGHRGTGHTSTLACRACVSLCVPAFYAALFVSHDGMEMGELALGPIWFTLSCVSIFYI